MESVLVTGVAGFIGFHTARRLLEEGRRVVGIDNLNAYYDPSLKEARLHELEGHPGFTFFRRSLEDKGLEEVFLKTWPEAVVHLAAQAGVRHSLENPRAYIDSNIHGFMNLLEAIRPHPVKHLVFASSSSVYGSSTRQPFSVHDNVDHPLSLYAATKKANELMAHSYAHLFDTPSTGLRFFTVYGPWGRPDMALFLFTKAILEGRPIDVYNFGHMKRDFTYIDDIVEGVVRVLDKPAEPNPSWTGEYPDPGSSRAPYRLYNIGNSKPVELLRFIEVLEAALGKPAEKNLLPMQPGDVPESFADVTDLMRDVSYRPSTPIEDGIPRFVKWYRDYYGV